MRSQAYMPTNGVSLLPLVDTITSSLLKHESTPPIPLHILRGCPPNPRTAVNKYQLRRKCAASIRRLPSGPNGVVHGIYGALSSQNWVLLEPGVMNSIGVLNITLRRQVPQSSVIHATAVPADRNSLQVSSAILYTQIH